MNGATPRPPAWLRRLALTTAADLALLGRMPAVSDGRGSAVLVLFGPDGTGPVPGPDEPPDPARLQIVLTERAATLRSHPGQVSFPGGRIDPGDAGPVGAALRETHEEVGIEPDEVEVVGQLPQLPLSVTGFTVTPVLGWWRHPHPLHVVDPAEVGRIAQVPVSHLVDPDNRFTAVHPEREFAAPAFEVDGLYVWGFTAVVLAEVLDLAGLAGPWDSDRRHPVPERYLRR